jgi:hypothetical protein
MDRFGKSFYTPGHTKRCATSYAVALVPGCHRSWMDRYTWSCRGVGTYGRDIVVDGDRSMGSW